ncbi:hypothetical protein CK203_035706 [Vitis vinifera]|uniref:Uncharacterized protein n=1 Tax=Vitis vinifera TaxID=29760 RepID=A0A438ICL3_VITVI|nr:hypothetical protein CK203_035706 [Vitis vinifera]
MASHRRRPFQRPPQSLRSPSRAENLPSSGTRVPMDEVRSSNQVLIDEMDSSNPVNVFGSISSDVTELKLYNKHQLVGYDHYDSLGCDWGCVFKWEVGIVIGVVFSNGNWNTQAKQVHPDKNPSDPLAVERSQVSSLLCHSFIIFLMLYSPSFIPKPSGGPKRLTGSRLNLCIPDLYNSGSDIDDFSSHWCPEADHPPSQDLRSVLMMIFHCKEDGFD